MDVRGSEGLGDRMVGEESDLFSFGKLRKGCFSFAEKKYCTCVVCCRQDVKS